MIGYSSSSQVRQAFAMLKGLREIGVKVDLYERHDQLRQVNPTPGLPSHKV